VMGPILYPGPPNVPGTESTVGYPYIWPAKVQQHQNPWRHRGGFGVPPTVPGPGVPFLPGQGYVPGPGGQYPL